MQHPQIGSNKEHIYIHMYVAMFAQIEESNKFEGIKLNYIITHETITSNTHIRSFRETHRLIEQKEKKWRSKNIITSHIYKYIIIISSSMHINTTNRLIISQYIIIMHHTHIYIKSILHAFAYRINGLDELGIGEFGWTMM